MYCTSLYTLVTLSLCTKLPVVYLLVVNTPDYYIYCIAISKHSPTQTHTYTSPHIENAHYLIIMCQLPLLLS